VDHRDPTGPIPKRVFGAVLRVESGQSLKTVRAEDYALQCVFGHRGRATYLLGGKLHEVTPGSVLWLAPRSAGALLDSNLQNVSEGFTAWYGYFGAQVVSQASRNASTEFLLNSAEGATLLGPLTKVSARRLEAQFEHLAVTDLSIEQFAVGLEYLLLSAWAEHQQATRVGGLADVHPAVEKAAYILRTQPESGSMQDLAHTCGASASWLSRLFRQQVGISLVGFRNQSRIERFFELYGEGHRRNLTQAAYAAGFGSYAQFHRVFKEALGYSPGELKRNLRGQTTPPSVR
jgi:AraC-like DNA-binding protein